MEKDKLDTAQMIAEEYAEEPETTEAEPEEEKSTVITMDEEKLFIAPVGWLDTLTSAELSARIGAYDHADKDIELDFENVEYISSAGLRLLVSLQKQARANGRSMTIRCVNAAVGEVFRISGFDKAFTII